MKTMRTALVVTIAIGLFGVVIQGCSDNNNGPTELMIESMTVGEADLNSAESPSDVPVDASIQIEFNSELQAETATSDNISLIQDYNSTNIELDISVDGPVLTITPQSVLGAGILYRLQLSGLVNVDDQTLGNVERSFQTAGTFSPPGMIANWTFEGTADDQMGNYNPVSDGVVDISYVDSRNEEAGEAAEFNGSTSIIEVPNAPEIASTGQLTVAMWLRPDTSAHGGGNFVLGAGGFNGFVVELNMSTTKMAAQYVLQDGSTGAQDLWVDGGGNTDFAGWTFSKDYSSEGGFAEVVQEQWTHFVFQYDSETRIGRVYINGELAKRQNFNEYPEDNPFYQANELTFNSQEGLGENMAIGYYADRATTIYSWADYSDPETNHYSGLMDDIKIYHKALTETEIQLMYDSES